MGINLTVTETLANSSSQDRRSLQIRITSNFCSWSIHRTFAELQSLDSKIRCHHQTLKLPRFPRPNASITIINQYLWRLLRRAYIDNDDSKECELGDPYLSVHVVAIQRVVRFQKEHKFTVHLGTGSFSIRCADRPTFQRWTEEIKKMINLRDGYTPYLIRWTDDHLDQQDTLSVSDQYAPSMSSADSKCNEQVDVDIVSCFNMSDEAVSVDSIDELLKQSLSDTEVIAVIPSISTMKVTEVTDQSQKSDQISDQKLN